MPDLHPQLDFWFTLHCSVTQNCHTEVEMESAKTEGRKHVDMTAFVAFILTVWHCRPDFMQFVRLWLGFRFAQYKTTNPGYTQLPTYTLSSDFLPAASVLFSIPFILMYSIVAQKCSRGNLYNKMNDSSTRRKHRSTWKCLVNSAFRSSHTSINSTVCVICSTRYASNKTYSFFF